MWWLVKRSAAIFLETVPFGTAIPGFECSIQEGDFPMTEKFKIIFFAWISNYSPVGVWYFKQRLRNLGHPSWHTGLWH